MKKILAISLIIVLLLTVFVSCTKENESSSESTNTTEAPGATTSAATNTSDADTSATDTSATDTSATDSSVTTSLSSEELASVAESVLVAALEKTFSLEAYEIQFEMEAVIESLGAVKQNAIIKTNENAYCVISINEMDGETVNGSIYYIDGFIYMMSDESNLKISATQEQWVAYREIIDSFSEVLSDIDEIYDPEISVFTSYEIDENGNTIIKMTETEEGITAEIIVIINNDGYISEISGTSDYETEGNTYENSVNFKFIAPGTAPVITAPTGEFIEVNYEDLFSE